VGKEDGGRTKGCETSQNAGVAEGADGDNDSLAESLLRLAGKRDGRGYWDPILGEEKPCFDRAGSRFAKATFSGKGAAVPNREGCGDSGPGCSRVVKEPKEKEAPRYRCLRLP